MYTFLFRQLFKRLDVADYIDRRASRRLTCRQSNLRAQIVVQVCNWFLHPPPGSKAAYKVNAYEVRSRDPIDDHANDSKQKQTHHGGEEQSSAHCEVYLQQCNINS